MKRLLAAVLATAIVSVVVGFVAATAQAVVPVDYPTTLVDAGDGLGLRQLAVFEGVEAHLPSACGTVYYVGTTAYVEPTSKPANCLVNGTHYKVVLPPEVSCFNGGSNWFADRDGPFSIDHVIVTDQTVTGTDGNDVVCAYGDAQQVDTGAGTDGVWASESGDSQEIATGDGDDLIRNYSTQATISGGEGFDTIYDYSWAEFLTNDGDALEAGTLIVGGLDADLVVLTYEDPPLETATAMRVAGVAPGVTIKGSAGNDKLTAPRKRDAVYGGAGRDICRIKKGAVHKGCEVVKYL